MATTFARLTRWPKKLARRELAPLCALLVLATCVRLPFMPFPGYWHDLASYVTWGNELVSHGFSQLYANRVTTNVFPGSDHPGGSVSLAISYPPGMPYLFAGVVVLYDLLLAPFAHAPLTELVVQWGIGPFISKLVLLAADLASTALLYHEARKRHSQRFAWLAAASFAFSPAVLYNGVIWGQTDALAMLPVLVAVFATLSERYTLAGASLVIALFIKPQTAIVIPLVLLYLWRWADRQAFIRCAVSLLAAALLLLLPIMIPRFQLFDMIYNMRAVALNDHFAISQDAFNFWWLTNLHARSMGSLLLGIRIGFVADALFGVVTLIIALQIWRHREPAYLSFSLAMEAFGFFVFMGGQLERYLFPFIPLMLATLIVSQRKSSDHLLVLYVAGTAYCLLNMLVSIGAVLANVSPIVPYVNLPPLTIFLRSYFGQLGFAIAAYVVVTFGHAMWIYLSGRFEPLVEGASSRTELGARSRAHTLSQT